MPDSDMTAVRKKVSDVRDDVLRLSYEIENLRRSMSASTGECKNAYRLVIRDKIVKLEHAVVSLPHAILGMTLVDSAHPTTGEILANETMR